MRFLPKAPLSLVVVCLMSAAITPTYSGTTPKPTLKSGLYLGFGFNRVSIGGHHDGDHFISGGGSMEILPELDAGIGTIFAFGYQFILDEADNTFGDVEMSYENTDHDGDWLGAEYPSTFRSLNFDFRFGMGRKMLPFVVGGFGFGSVTVEDGSTDGVREVDAELSTFHLRAGAGVHFPLHSRLGLNLQAVYRWGDYDHVDGIASGDIDGFDGNGFTLTVVGRFVFSGD